MALNTHTRTQTRDVTGKCADVLVGTASARVAKAKAGRSDYYIETGYGILNGAIKQFARSQNTRTRAHKNTPLTKKMVV